MDAQIMHWILTHQSWIMTAAVGGLLLFVLVSLRSAWREVSKMDNALQVLQTAFIRPIYEQLAPKTAADERTLRMRLSRAGINDEAGVRKFILGRISLLGFAFAVTAMVGILSLAVGKMPLVFLVTVGAAWLLPNFWLDTRIDLRKQRISRVLPSVVDLLVLCLDVGLSLDASFARVTTEIRSMEPLMAEEADFMRSEMQSGMSFSTCLKRMAECVDLEELINLSRLISQATDLGTSITSTLREYAEQSFQKRSLALEEYAGKVSARLVLPLTLCFLPAIMITLVGPAIIKMASVFGGGK